MDQTATAILDLLRSFDVPPGGDISLYRVGVPLTAEGYSEDDLRRGLERLISDRVIEMVPGTNAVRLTPHD